MYTTIDLFAGAGGLSLGFLQTGAFKIVLAAENNAYAQKTYMRNHPGTVVIDDVRKIDYTLVRKKYGQIDVVIGGPPCQGFSNANRQRAMLSANNGLVKEYVRAIVELKPRVFLMENVSALKSDVHRFYVSEGEENIVRELGLTCRKDKIVLALSFPELNELQEALTNAFMLCENYLWSKSFYHAVKILNKKTNDQEGFNAGIKKYKGTLMRFAKKTDHGHPNGQIKNVYEHFYASILHFYKEQPQKTDDVDELKNSINLCFCIQEAFKRLDELQKNHVKIQSFSWNDGIYAEVQSYSVLDYIKCRFAHENLSYKLNYGILNAAQFGVPQKRERFIMLGSRIGEAPKLPDPIIKKESEYYTVRDAISDLEKIKPTVEYHPEGIPLELIDTTGRPLLSVLRNSPVLYNHFRTNTGKTAQDRFEILSPGQNFHDLPQDLQSSYSKGERTQSTIYLKLKYDEPSGTVLNVRKSMWTHPAESRALSAREAARLQTFPDSFEFIGTKDSQYQQIGNAVPPILAKAIAEQMIVYLKEHMDKESVQDRVIFELAVDPYAKQSDIARKLNVSPAYISMIIKKLYERGILEDVRAGKKTGWRVIQRAEKTV